MRFFTFVVLSLLVVGCHKRESFESGSSISASDLVKDGWIPEILPGSARSLDIVKMWFPPDLSKRATGLVYFRRHGAKDFKEKISAEIPSELMIAEVRQQISEHAKERLVPYSHVQGDTAWVFYCEPAKFQYCHFFMFELPANNSLQARRP